MQQFEIANRIKATLGSFDRDAFAHQVDALIERLTPDFLAGTEEARTLTFQS